MAKHPAKPPQFVSPAEEGPGYRLPGQSLADKARAAGKVLRKRTPRLSHDEIGTLPKSRDPVAMIIASEEGLAEEPIADTPFTDARVRLYFLPRRRRHPGE